ncbi:tRNA (guanosine(37)-N1)-methyltransferase TrmD [Patescibacteria group bacterium]|nr:tRNA (guanosine(37)-N1)-methyltransferase TrmD [Patescibacteria group bacterium]
MAKIQFDIITIFPHIFDSYINESILGRAQKKNLIEINTHDLRDYTSDKHRTVDDTPYGGGAGMVLMAEPILKAVDKITKKKSSKKSKIVVFSAKGKQFNQKMAYDWSEKLDQIIMICGRYEGIDERIIKSLDAEEISVGPYVLTDGEIPAMTVVSAISRLMPGVITLESLKEESHWNLLLKKEKDATKDEGLEYPHYTRPEVVKYKGKKYHVPEILLSGNHAEIEKWRKSHKK